MGPTTRPQIRTAGSAEPHTGSRPSASSPGPATEFDLPTLRWEATARATQAGNAGPRARARGRRKNHHRHQRLSIAERYHLAPLTLTRNTHSLDS